MFDDRHLSYQLETMKMAHASLRQLMLLSSGGLALFFGLIGNLNFISSSDILSSCVLISWVLSLTAAAYSHSKYTQMFTILARFATSMSVIDDLEKLPLELEDRLKVNPDTNRLKDLALKDLYVEINRISISVNDFQKSFFPAQTVAILTMRSSLFFLIFGFACLGMAYIT